MQRKAKLTKRQLAVIHDLFADELDEQAVLQKHRVSAKLYDKWQGEDAFIERIERRIVAGHRQGAVLIARYAPVAATKLVELTQCEKEETARKACVDIISMQPRPTTPPKSQSPDIPERPPQLTNQLATRLLAALAEEKQYTANDD